MRHFVVIENVPNCPKTVQKGQILRKGIVPFFHVLSIIKKMHNEDDILSNSLQK